MWLAASFRSGNTETLIVEEPQEHPPQTDIARTRIRFRDPRDIRQRSPPGIVSPITVLRDSSPSASPYYASNSLLQNF